MPYYWVVFVGRNPGIYSTWEEAEAEIIGYSRNKHRKYNTLEEAEEALCKFHEDKFSQLKKKSSVGACASTSARPLELQIVVEREPNVRSLAFLAAFFIGFVACILLAHFFDLE